ncbi:hypothetical protein KS4_22000 [Poriferisphaera corsica]|uniref:Uncharacterized protein n=1 Tax=Poriferisphaera corsica TaxID=2528020 RepID=A0A517YV77_9BACT|nr:hypothetical protein [Poriferisphaera corsica]QDU34138.1 hypothetical protein KS4_22000 [Poriferisphaera corsica]
MRVSKAVRHSLSIIFGALWATMLLVIGLSCFAHANSPLIKLVAVAMIAAAEFITMTLVADELCPLADVKYTSAAKLITITTLLLATASAIGTYALNGI